MSNVSLNTETKQFYYSVLYHGLYDVMCQLKNWIVKTLEEWWVRKKKKRKEKKGKDY